MASPQQSTPDSSPRSFANLPLELRDRIYTLAMPHVKSVTRISLTKKPLATARTFAHTSCFVRQEAVAIYHSQTTFCHGVNFSTCREGLADAFVHSNARLQNCLATWGALAMPHIRTLEINVSERDVGVGYFHQMHIDLRNVDKPVRTGYDCWGECCLERDDPRTPDAHLKDVNALVRSLLVTFPDGEKVLTAARFEAIMKELWYSYTCIGEDSAIVGEHVDRLAMCARRQCPSCGCVCVNPCAGTYRSVILAPLVIVSDPIDTLAGATNADQLIFGRCAGGDANALRLLSLCGCLHAVVYTLDYVESRVLRGWHVGSGRFQLIHRCALSGLGHLQPQPNCQEASAPPTSNSPEDSKARTSNPPRQQAFCEADPTPPLPAPWNPFHGGMILRRLGTGPMRFVMLMAVRLPGYTDNASAPWERRRGENARLIEIGSSDDEEGSEWVIASSSSQASEEDRNLDADDEDSDSDPVIETSWLYRK